MRPNASLSATVEAPRQAWQRLRDEAETIEDLGQQARTIREICNHELAALREFASLPSRAEAEQAMVGRPLPADAAPVVDKGGRRLIYRGHTLEIASESVLTAIELLVRAEGAWVPGEEIAPGDWLQNPASAANNSKQVIYRLRGVLRKPGRPELDELAAALEGANKAYRLRPVWRS